MEQLPRKRTNPWPWVAGGCVVAVVVLGGFVAFILSIVFASMRSAEPYATSVERAQRDPRVIAALGAPVKPGLFVTGKIQVQNRDGYADLGIPISGPKQKGRITVVATKNAGRWSYQEMLVTPDSGTAIDLRTSSERSPSTATPAE